MIFPINRSECSDCQFTVRLGAYDLAREDEPSSMQVFNVVEVREHPQFIMNAYTTNDLAIMVLDRTPRISRYVMPLCLPPPSARSDTFAGQKAFMVGWGRTSL
ncbi:hypothetical protein L9F63_011089, partial [Diploptera punctata]